MQSATERKSLKGPVKVMRTHMSVDLIKAGTDKEKLDGKSNKILLELWLQVKLEQWFWLLAKARTKKWKPEPKPQVRPLCLQDFLLERKLTPPGPSQEDRWAIRSN